MTGRLHAAEGRWFGNLIAVMSGCLGEPFVVPEGRVNRIRVRRSSRRCS